MTSMAGSQTNERSIAMRFICLIFIVAVMSFIPSVANSKASSQPNILFIVSDYMGYADIEPYGSTDIKTPVLSALAQEGAKYESHYSAAPQCIPSRASMLSGLYPSKALERKPKTRGVGLSSQNSHLVGGLKSAGYRAAMIGKWHLGSDVGFAPLDHGFDHYFGFDSWALGYHSHLTSDGEPGLERNGSLVSESGYLPYLFAEEAINFIGDRPGSPFFVYLSFNTGLPPYQPPEMPKEDWGSGWDASEGTREVYAAMIEAMDESIGSVVDHIEKIGQRENTLVVFTYDHGGRHMADSGSLFHGFATLWEGGIRVPLIMRWPGVISAGKVVSAPTISMDVTASMLSAAGSTKELESLDGVSLIFEGDRDADFEDRPLFWRYRDMKAVRQGQWKYLVDGYTQMLFDLTQDAGERDDVFYSNIDVANKLKRLLEAWEAPAH